MFTHYRLIKDENERDFMIVANEHTYIDTIQLVSNFLVSPFVLLPDLIVSDCLIPLTLLIWIELEFL